MTFSSASFMSSRQLSHRTECVPLSFVSIHSNATTLDVDMLAVRDLQSHSLLRRSVVRWLEPSDLQADHWGKKRQTYRVLWANSSLRSRWNSADSQKTTHQRSPEMTADKHECFCLFWHIIGCLHFLLILWICDIRFLLKNKKGLLYCSMTFKNMTNAL